MPDQSSRVLNGTTYESLLHAAKQRQGLEYQSPHEIRLPQDFRQSSDRPSRLAAEMLNPDTQLDALRQGAAERPAFDYLSPYDVKKILENK